MSEWISVEDRLPDFEFVIVAIDKRMGLKDRVRRGRRLNPGVHGRPNVGEFWWQDDQFAMWEPRWITNWMPLPAPPTEEE